MPGLMAPTQVVLYVEFLRRCATALLAFVISVAYRFSMAWRSFVRAIIRLTWSWRTTRSSASRSKTFRACLSIACLSLEVVPADPESHAAVCTLPDWARNSSRIASPCSCISRLNFSSRSRSSRASFITSSVVRGGCEGSFTVGASFSVPMGPVATCAFYRLAIGTPSKVEPSDRYAVCAGGCPRSLTRSSIESMTEAICPSL